MSKSKIRIACWGEAEKLFLARDSILLRENCEVLLAGSAAELVDLARRTQPNLVLIDAEAAGGECLRLCRMLKRGRLTASLPIVLICPRADEELGRALSELGVEGILIQPTPHRLSQSLARVLGLGVREHPRYPVQTPVQVHVEGKGGALSSRMIDLSLQGAQLEIEHPLQIGSIVNLVLPAGGSEAPLQIQATVRRIMADPLWGRNRLGVYFPSLEPAARGRLQVLLEQLAQNVVTGPPVRPESPPPRHFF